ncbi:MAG: prepilin-type N-terminal cleavage/methylation domain-containing protein [Phycisphaerae bacterium]|nr:prepilin-type N-terminal cleavage/methylation domain-containing protein [Phycisphaerae bacterium]
MAPDSARRGFTFVELLIATAILAMSATAAMLALTAGVQRVQESSRYAQAVVLAESLMEEIVNRPFEDPEAPSVRNPGPGPDETDRTKFDNVDDYDGYSESDKVLRELRTGLPAIAPSNSAGLWRRVSVQYITLNGQAAWDQNNVVRVTVTVNDGDGGPIFVLSRVVVREY